MKSESPTTFAAAPAAVAPHLDIPAVLDTIRLNEIPEGVDLGLRVAGPAARAVALAIDGAIPLALYLAMTPLLVLSDIGIGLILIGPFLLEWLYPVIFEVLLGATPGKRSMGLVVVQNDGTPRGLPASLIRNLLRAVDFLPLFYGVGLVSMLADRDFRRLGDLAAGTLVVYGGKRPDGRGESYGVPRVDPLGQAPSASPRAATADPAGNSGFRRAVPSAVTGAPRRAGSDLGAWPLRA